jgi:hypothetical protein
MGPGGNTITNSNNYIFNRYREGGIGGSTIANRNAKNRLASFCDTGCAPIVTPTIFPTTLLPSSTMLVYNTTQGSSIDWSGNTFTLNPNLSNFSYTATITSTPIVAPPFLTNIISVTIGNIVISIGNSAFKNCSNIVSVVFTPDSQVTSIGNQAFSNCSKLTSIILPNSITTIGSNGFSNCSKLTSIILPNSITTIGDLAFSNCTALTSIILPNLITTINSFVFYNCSALTSIIIPNLVIIINNQAFFDCSALTSIILPNSLTIIGSRAFNNCSALTSITIPNSITSINTIAFTLCSGLTTIYISNTKAVQLGNLFVPGQSWSSPSSAISNFFGAPNPVNFLLPI